MMGSTAQVDRELFGGAPFLTLLRRFRVLPTEGSHLARRALIAVLVAWMPLLFLTVAEGSFFKSRDANSFLPDLAVHARFLVALPLCAAAQTLLATQLTGVVQHFLDVGIIRAADRDEFDATVSSTKRLVHSTAAELTAIALGFALVATVILSAPLDNVPAWHLDPAAPGELSRAGWWHTWVSLPLLLIALFAVLWRWCLWVRLLRRVSKLSLALVPAHPDGVAGLQFVSYSVRAYAPFGLLLGVIVAGSVANRVIYGHASPYAYSHMLGALLVIVVVLFSGPLLVFTRTLLAAWRRGIYDYDALADRVGRQFEAQWCDQGDNVDVSALSRQDFSATTDLYSVVANVYRMRLFLFDLQGVLLLVSATAAPFVPVVLLTVPIDTILSRVSDVLL